MILNIGIALLLMGIGLGIYSEFFSRVSTYEISIPANNVPAWFANVIAVTYAIFGIALIVLGATELDPDWVNRWLNNNP